MKWINFENELQLNVKFPVLGKSKSGKYDVYYDEKEMYYNQVEKYAEIEGE